MKKNIWHKTIVNENQNIEDALKSLKNSGLQIALITDKNKKLKGTITDGDLRQFIIKKKNFSIKCKNLMNKKPIVVKKNVNDEKIISLMKKYPHSLF